MDAKKTDPALPSWDAQTEQDIFGNQAPYATGPHTATALTTDTDDSAPSIYQAHPYQPNTTRSPKSSSLYPDLEGSLPGYSRNPGPMPTAPSLMVKTQLTEQLTPRHTPEPARQSERAPNAHQPSHQQLLPTQPFTPSSNDMRSQSTPSIAPYKQQNSPGATQSSPLYYGSISPHGQQGHLDTRAPLFRDRRSDSSMSRSTRSSISDCELEPLVSERKNTSEQRTWALLRRCNRYIIGGILLWMLIVYFLSRALIAIVDPCALTNDISMHLETTQLFSSTLWEISVSMLDYIPGNVVIRESDDWDQEEVLLRFHKRSTSTKVLDDLHLKVESNPSSFFRAFPLFRTEDADEKQKLLHGHCTRVDVELIYPRGMPYPQLLTVNRDLGNVHIQLDSTSAIFDSMRLDVTDGNIFIEGLSIKDEASFRVGTGKLQGSMRAIGEVNLETTVGDIDVELHPSLVFQDSGSENLNVTMKSKEGSVKLVMAQRYQGHFSLFSGKKQQAIFPGSSAYPEMIKYSAHSEHRSEGWVTEDGKKPAAALPRLAISADAGSAVVLREDTHS